MGSELSIRDQQEQNREWSRGGVQPSWLDSRWAIWVSVALIVLATVAAYSNSFGGPFIFDDVPSIPDNSTIQRLWPIWKPFCPPNDGQTVTGRPMLNFSFAVNHALGGTNTWGYHLANLLIHMAAALTLFGLLRRTLRLPSMRDRWARPPPRWPRPPP